ncbi:hypothetical protein BH18ACI3_BH18ACI3_14620 [soil metagenome]
MFKTGLILALIFSIQMLLGCNTADNGGNNNSVKNSDMSDVTGSTIKDNVEELGTLVKLPLEPEEVTWKEFAPNSSNSEQTGSQNLKKLTAVMRFSNENAKKIVGQVENKQAGESASLGAEPWFPAELIAQSELNGDDTLKGTSYSAADFYQPPFTDGKIIRIENTDFFILELVSK